MVGSRPTDSVPMRRYRFLATIGLLAMLACGDDAPTGESKLALPADPSPADQAANQSNVLDLSWSVDGSGKNFDVFLGPTEEPPLVASGLTTPHYRTARLATATTYYWRVVNAAMIGETDGPLWSFATAPGAPPDPPTLIAPPDGADVAQDEINLQWSAAAPEDSISYRVYFGTQAAPPMVATDLHTSTYAISVNVGETYYWQIESRNGDGLGSTSPVWRFKALPVPGHMYNMAGTGAHGTGEVDQLPLATDLNWPQDIAFDHAGSLVIVDWNNHRVLRADPASGHLFVVVGSPEGMTGDPCGPYPLPCDGVDPSEATLTHPTSVTFAGDGKMALSAWHNSGVFILDFDSNTMNRVAGIGKPCYDGDEKPANTACIYLPAASVFDLEGRLCFTDQANMIIRMVDAGGVIHRIAGQEPVFNGSRYVPQAGFFGDEGPATSAKFKWDGSTTCGKLCIDAAGNIYVADTLNHAVRMIDPAGIIHRFAGLFPATPGFGGDGGPATSAQLQEPRDVACDADGNVFIADTGNDVIRMVSPSGIISTVAGVPGVVGGSFPDGKPAVESPLNLPYGIDIDPLGNLWIADTYNNRIRIVYR